MHHTTVGKFWRYSGSKSGHWELVRWFLVMSTSAFILWYLHFMASVVGHGVFQVVSSANKNKNSPYEGLYFRLHYKLCSCKNPPLKIWSVREEEHLLRSGTNCERSTARAENCFSFFRFITFQCTHHQFILQLKSFQVCSETVFYMRSYSNRLVEMNNERQEAWRRQEAFLLSSSKS